MTATCDHDWSAEWRKLSGADVVVIECGKCGKEELLDERRLFD